MQNITKHHYLLCSVKVSHLKKHTFYDLWAPKSGTKREILKNTNKNDVKCRLIAIIDPKGDQKSSTLSPRNASWAHPGQSFCSPVANYSHLASTDYQKAVKMSPKVSKILFQKSQIQSISIKSTYPSNVH